MSGKVVILCAPSGSGKTTLAKHLLSIKKLNLKFSVSATTRKKRVNEDDKPSIPSTKFIAFTIPINTKQENKTENV